jgi:cytochrome P450
MPATSAHELNLPELDLFGLERAEVLGAIRAARAEHWLARTPLGFMFSDYRDAVAILRDRRFHSALSLLPQMAGIETGGFMENRRPSILAMEGAEHARLRRLVAPAFTPAATDRLRPFMREVVSGLVDEVAEEARCEFVADICEPYPIPIICALLGAPKEDWKLFSQWATDIFRLFNQDLATDLPSIERASGELEAYVTEMIDERRQRACDGLPGDDLLSTLIAIEEEGDRLSEDELVMLIEAVLMAGTDTTRNQLGCSVALLAEHPEQWALLAERPELAPRAVEESMRYLGAVRGTIRVASEDIEYRDVLFPAGTLVSVALASANMDSGVFADPETFDITAERDALQMTFGSGIHFCMGAALARAELQEALPLLARRMPGLRSDGPVEWKPANFGIWGPARLPLRFDPPTRSPH